MRYGQLTKTKTRKMFKCQHCEEEIQAGEDNWAIKYFKKVPVPKTWFVHLHIGCLLDWAVKEEEKYKDRLQERRKVKGIRIGRPSIELPEDKKRLRARYLQYVYMGKDKLLYVYQFGTRKHIQTKKRYIAGYLRRILEEDLGGLPNYRLNFNNKEKAEEFVEALISREPMIWVKELQNSFGDVNRVIELLEVEGTLGDEEYGYTGQEKYD